MIELGATAGSITSDLVSMVLDAAVMRHAALASNIANANTDGYQPVRVSFEDTLAQYRTRFLDRQFDAASRRLISTLSESIRVDELPVTSTAERVKLDEEVAKMARNTVLYQALLEARGRADSIISTAINEGRG